MEVKKYMKDEATKKRHPPKAHAVEDSAVSGLNDTDDFLFHFY